MLDGRREAPGRHPHDRDRPRPSGLREARAAELREWAWQALALARHAVEPLPARLRASARLPGAADALVAAHFPRSEADAAEARARLAFEELLLYQAALARGGGAGERRGRALALAGARRAGPSAGSARCPSS